MQEKYQELYEKLIEVLVKKLDSREDAEEIFNEMGPTVILESTNKMLDQVKLMEDAGNAEPGTLKEIIMMLENDDQPGAYGRILDLGIDSSKIMQDTFMRVYEDVLKVFREE